MYSKNTTNILFYGGAGFVFGIIAFVKGFKNLTLKRLIENIPTSKIRSMPMGLVEISGTAVQTYEINTPFSNMPCVYFQYLIEEYRHSGKSGHWATVAKASSPFPFKVQDDTGDVSVNPGGAEVDLQTKHCFTNSFFDSLPPTAREFLDKNAIDYTGFFGTEKKMRLTEYFIPPLSPVYVLGVAKHSGTSAEPAEQYQANEEKKKELIMNTLKKLKDSPFLHERYDLNKDGSIDNSEWEKAREDVIKWVDGKMSAEPPAKTEDIRVERGKGNEGQVFFISDSSHKELVSKMFFKSWGYIFGGAALAIGGAAAFLFSIS